MAKKLIGTAITNENGEATITYTGTGAGKINLIAESDTFVSEVYELWDTLFYDSGVTGVVDSRWKTVGGTGSINSNNSGTTFENTNSTTRFDNFIKNDSNEIYFWKAPFCIEIDIVTVTGAPRLQIFSRTTSAAVNTCGGTGHWKIICNEETVIVTKNNSSSTTYERAFNDNNIRIGFYVSQGESITFKDLKIYTI